jgi:hypothetical protein
MLDILWCVTKFLPLLYKIVMVIFNHSIIKLLWSFFVRLADDHHMPPSTSIRLSFASPCRLPDFPLPLNPSSLTDMPPPTLLACDSGHAPTAPPHGLPSLGLTIIPRPPMSNHHHHGRPATWRRLHHCITLSTESASTPLMSFGD